jgi:hypothetical protein
MFVPGKTFLPSLMFTGKAGAYLSEAPFTAIHFHPSLIFAGKASGLPEWEPLLSLNSNGRLLALPANIRLRWE